MFYRRGEDGLPHEWLEKVKNCIRKISPQFNAQRMIREYMDQLYEPAYEAGRDFAAQRFEKTRQRCAWTARVQRAWDQVRFVDTGARPDNLITGGQAIPFRVTVELAGLEPDDVRVEAVVGHVYPDGHLEETEVITLRATERKGSACVYEYSYIPRQTGRVGYALRVSPNHVTDPLTRPSGDLIRWA